MAGSASMSSARCGHSGAASAQAARAGLTGSGERPGEAQPSAKHFCPQFCLSRISSCSSFCNFFPSHSSCLGFQLFCVSGGASTL